MRAVGYHTPLPVTDPDCLLDVKLPEPEPGPHDVLVRVEAVSVNPADVKTRGHAEPPGGFAVLGFDGAGVVERAGPAVTRFRPGDEVFYAGSVRRPGSNAELQAVDERIVGHKPASLSMAEAAAMPLTSITAWEALFDHLRLNRDSTGTLLVVAAAGGVGSMVTQLAAAGTALTVIGTASRAESAAWARQMGAHEIVDHHGGLAGQVLAAQPEGIEYVVSPYSDKNVDEYAELLRPRGHVVAMDQVTSIQALKAKSITWHWELMFTRPSLEPSDDYQHRLLDEVAQLVDAGLLRTTMTTTLGPLNAETLREAHRLVETSSTIGKVVVTRDPAG
jgi:zinc-binding alcohol dehydrogenase family protein